MVIVQKDQRIFIEEKLIFYWKYWRFIDLASEILHYPSISANHFHQFCGLLQELMCPTLGIAELLDLWSLRCMDEILIFYSIANLLDCPLILKFLHKLEVKDEYDS